MPSSHILQMPYGLPDNPEEFGGALAHVIAVQSNKEVVLGQAWLAGINRLITCGHVVEQYASNPALLTVKFPLSGNVYQVLGLRMHPSFVRQPDQLVKFDVAVLTVELVSPEKDTSPLPIVFEKTLRSQQPLSAIRYPTHLGSLTAAPNPLAQLGRMLGSLRKHDAFHLLHDLALAPGDSGAAIFDGTTVVAIHCGDTATLPGLNLPTTAIRLMLWVDALRELGITETQATREPSKGASFSPAAVAFIVAGMVSFVLALFVTMAPMQKNWAIKQPAILPINLSFDKPLRDYKYKDELKLVFLPRSDSYLYVFNLDPKEDSASMIYPSYGEFPSYLHAGQARLVDSFGDYALGVGNSKEKLHIVSLISQTPLLDKGDFERRNPANNPLTIKGSELVKRIQSLKSKDPSNVLHLVMDAPNAEENGK